MSRLLSTLGLLVMPVGIVAAAEYEVMRNHAGVGWHVLDALLVAVFIYCAIGITGEQPGE